MSEMKKDALTPENRKLLQKLEESISHEKVTVGFSIEGRDVKGRKRWASYTTTVSCRDEGGWSFSELQIVNCLVTKRVVSATCGAAFRRGLMTKGEALEEARALLRSYDANIVGLLGKGDTE